MTQITGIAPTTELEAVNAMLSAIGEAPIAQAALTTITAADVDMAVNLLRNTTREVLSMGWKFNTEFGFQLAQSATYAWTGVDGTTATLGIFKRPAGMLKFSVTPCDGQGGSSFPDMVLRPSRSYQESGASVEVFYDRAKNRDGFDVTERTYLYIDPVWAFDFEQMPEVARRYCTIHAARQFIQQTVGSTTLSGFAQQDEALAYRNLKREEGETDSYSMLKNMAVLGAFGRRPINDGVLYDPRASTGTS